MLTDPVNNKEGIMTSVKSYDCAEDDIKYIAQTWYMNAESPRGSFTSFYDSSRLAVTSDEGIRYAY
jgi:hypothetical protein